MMQAAEVAAENQRMRGRKPKAPQYYEFYAALNVRPPFFELANEARLQECGSLPAEPSWRDSYARLPHHPWRLPDYREPPLLLFDKKLGRPARDVENEDGLQFVTSAMKAYLERVDPDACEFRKCDTQWTSGEAGLRSSHSARWSIPRGKTSAHSDRPTVNQGNCCSMFEFITRKLDRRKLWGCLRDYPEYAPPFRGKRKLKRVQAEANFEFFMSQRETRLASLKDFLARFDVDMRLQREALPAIDKWLLRYGGHLLPGRGRSVSALEEFEPPYTGEVAGMNIVNDISIFAGEYIIKHNPSAKWGLFIGDGTRRSREYMGYYHPGLFGVHAHQPGHCAKYPLYLREEVFDCCRGSRRRLQGRWLPGKSKEVFFRKWGDDNEFVRRLEYWADETADPPTPFSQLTLR